VVEGYDIGVLVYVVLGSGIVELLTVWVVRDILTFGQLVCGRPAGHDNRDHQHRLNNGSE
jgi:hypothetical protein